jgi:hypothetical protein
VGVKQPFFPFFPGDFTDQGFQLAQSEVYHKFEAELKSWSPPSHPFHLDSQDEKPDDNKQRNKRDVEEPALERDKNGDGRTDTKMVRKEANNAGNQVREGRSKDDGNNVEKKKKNEENVLAARKRLEQARKSGMEDDGSRNAPENNEGKDVLKKEEVKDDNKNAESRKDVKNMPSLQGGRNAEQNPNSNQQQEAAAKQGVKQWKEEKFKNANKNLNLKPPDAGGKVGLRQRRDGKFDKAENTFRRKLLSSFEVNDAIFGKEEKEEESKRLRKFSDMLREQDFKNVDDNSTDNGPKHSIDNVRENEQSKKYLVDSTENKWKKVDGGRSEDRFVKMAILDNEMPSSRKPKETITDSRRTASQNLPGSRRTVKEASQALDMEDKKKDTEDSPAEVSEGRQAMMTDEEFLHFLKERAGEGNAGDGTLPWEVEGVFRELEKVRFPCR